MNLLKDEFPNKDVDVLKIRYLEESSGCYFSVKETFELDPNKFNENFATLMVEVAVNDPTKVAEDKKRAKDRNKYTRYENISRIDALELNLTKIKILLSAIIKYSSMNSPEIMTIVEQIYTEEEITALDLKELPLSQRFEFSREDSGKDPLLLN